MMSASFTYGQGLSVCGDCPHLQGTDRFIAIAGKHVPTVGQTRDETPSDLCPTLRQMSIDIHSYEAARTRLREVVQ